MKLVYAHRWLLEALASASVPKTYLLEPAKLLGTVSPEDVASYILTNESLSLFVPKEVVTSFSQPKWDLDDPAMKAVRDACVRLQVKHATGRGPSGLKHVPEEATLSTFSLSCELLGPDAIVLHHIPKEASASEAQAVQHFADRALRQLHTALRFEELVALPLMRWYLEARQTLLTPNRVVA